MELNELIKRYGLIKPTIFWPDPVSHNFGVGQNWWIWNAGLDPNAYFVDSFESHLCFLRGGGPAKVPTEPKLKMGLWSSLFPSLASWLPLFFFPSPLFSLFSLSRLLSFSLLNFSMRAAGCCYFCCHCLSKLLKLLLQAAAWEKKEIGDQASTQHAKPRSFERDKEGERERERELADSPARHGLTNWAISRHRTLASRPFNDRK